MKFATSEVERVGLSQSSPPLTESLVQVINTHANDQPLLT